MEFTAGRVDNSMVRASGLLLLSLAVPLGLSQERRPEELKSGAPYLIMFPAPLLLDPKFEDGSLVLPFRSLLSDRIDKYNVYVFVEEKGSEGKRRLLGSVHFSPARLSDCIRGSSVYGLAAVDRSGTEGTIGRISAPYACVRVIEEPKQP